MREAPKARRSLVSVYDADNMMMRETGTGIRHLSTRPTLKRIIDDDLGGITEAIAAVHPVTWATSREVFTELGTGVIQTEWNSLAEDGQSILDNLEDGRGGSYILTEGGRIERRNSEGEVAFDVTIPISSGMIITPRLLLDPLGGIYAAASSGVNGGQSMLVKFLPRLDSDGADMAWVFDVTGSEIADIALRGGQVFVGVNEPGRTARVIAIENTGEGEPFQSWEMPVPYPVSTVKYGQGLTFSSLPSTDRGDGSPIGGDDNIWQESDIANANQRVHAVYDARRAGDFPDGSRMTRLVELRDALGIESRDSTNRDLLQSQWFTPAANELTVQNSGSGSPGPRFRSQLADGEPAIWFNSNEGTARGNNIYTYDKGSSLWSQEVDASLTWKSSKVDVNSSLAGSSGLWPHTPDNNFVVAWKLRWPVGAGAGMVWSVGGWVSHLSDPGLDTDSLAIIVQDDSAVGTVSYKDGGIAIRGAITDSVQGGEAILIDGMWEAIVLIERRQVTDTSILRINGVVIDSTLEFSMERFQSPREVWGNRIYNEDHWWGYNLQTATYTPPAGYSWFTGANSFDGAIQKAVCIFAPTTVAATPHETDFPTLDLEKIEGAMAWRRQTGDVLADPLHTYKSIAPPRGAGAALPQETTTARALRSPDGIVGLLHPGQDSYGWAVAGAGIGYDHTADASGNIYTTGPQQHAISIPGEQGPRSQVFRRMIDRGLSVDYLRPSAGEIVIEGQPTIGDTFVIDPGDGAVTYEFDGAGTESTTYYSVAIGVDALSTMTNLVNTMTAGTGGTGIPNAGRFYASYHANLGGDVYSTAFESREAPTGVAVAIIATGTLLRVISGMDGGAAPDGAWDVREVTDRNQTDSRVHMASPDDGDLYTPWVSNEYKNEVVRLAKEDGSVIWTHRTGLSTVAITAVAVDRRETNFGNGVETHEFLWRSGDGAQGVEKWRLVHREPNSDPPQKTALLVVKGGQAIAIHEDNSIEELGAPGEFQAWDPYMQVLDYQGDLLISDGVTRMRWSPRNDTYEEWTAKRGSEIPGGSHLMAAWNTRIVHAGGENPYNWIMSAAGDPTDYELFPSQTSANQAVAGDSTEGLAETQDQITGLIPAGDDLLLILMSRSIGRMTGDPMADGVVDSMTRGVGGAFGNAWVQTPDGMVYFFGVPHAVYKMRADGNEIKNVSLGRIEEDLRAIDLEKYRIRMVYSHRMEGICVIPTPLSLDGEYDLRWWFLDREGAWWPQSWMVRAHQPLTVTASIGTGEPIFGCRDGHVRTMTGTDGLDDTDELASSVIFGPYFDRQYHLQKRFTKPFARIDGEAPIEWYAYVGDDPTTIGHPEASGVFIPKEETSGAMRAKGSSLWLELRAFGSRWAFEGGSFSQVNAGRQK